MSMSWRRVGTGVPVLSCVTRPHALVSDAPPAGSHGYVEGKVRTAFCQMASVGRRSTAPAAKSVPGCWGVGGSTNGPTTPAVVRFIVASAAGSPNPSGIGTLFAALVPVIRQKATSEVVSPRDVSLTTKTAVDPPLGAQAGRGAKWSNEKSYVTDGCDGKFGPPSSAQSKVVVDAASNGMPAVQSAPPPRTSSFTPNVSLSVEPPSVGSSGRYSGYWT